MSMTADFFTRVHCACCDFTDKCTLRKDAKTWDPEKEITYEMGICTYAEALQRIKTIPGETGMFFLVFTTRDMANYINAMYKVKTDTQLRQSALKIYAQLLTEAAKHDQTGFLLDLLNEDALEELIKLGVIFGDCTRPNQENKRENL